MAGRGGGSAEKPDLQGYQGTGMTLAPGLVSFARIVVTDTDTALAMGSGDVPVLGTPRLLALARRRRWLLSGRAWSPA